MKEHALHCAVTFFALCCHLFCIVPPCAACQLLRAGQQWGSYDWSGLDVLDASAQAVQAVFGVLPLCLRAGQQRHACTDCLCALTS